MGVSSSVPASLSRLILGGLRHLVEVWWGREVVGSRADALIGGRYKIFTVTFTAQEDWAGNGKR